MPSTRTFQEISPERGDQAIPGFLRLPLVWNLFTGSFNAIALGFEFFRGSSTSIGTSCTRFNDRSVVGNFISRTNRRKYRLEN